MKRQRIDWGEALAWGLLVLILVALFLAASTDKAKAEPICPPGSTPSELWVGHYTLYPPNPPAAYTRVVTYNPDAVYDNPTPGQYLAEHILVCYNPNAIPEIIYWCDGVPMADGTCMTVKRYDDVFSFEALSETESLALPGRTVADVYGITPRPRASDRARLNGEPSFAEIVARLLMNRGI